MDGQQFDRFSQSLSRGMPRRSALAVLAGLGVAAVTGVGEVAARRHHGNKQAHKRGQKRQGARAQGGKPKTTLCHFEVESNTWHPITVSSKKERQQHLAHGDHLCTEGQPCSLSTGCGGGGQTCTGYPARAVVTWNGDGYFDLDAYFTLADGGQASYGGGSLTEYPFAQHSGDIQSSPGEETIRFTPQAGTSTYSVLAYNGTFAGSGAVVNLYCGDTLFATYTPPADLVGNNWTVFTVDQNGTVGTSSALVAALTSARVGK